MLTTALLLLISTANALYTPAPQMGWNTWNKYGCNVSEDIVVGAAQSIVDRGLDKLGYNYVILDDCWALKQRDNTTSKIVADSTKFPSGMKGLADKIHALGLKFGMYSSAGFMTCGGYPGSLDYEKLDAQTFADWGVDYLKYDNCFNEGRTTPIISHERYKNMTMALNATGRDIFYSLCSWGDDGVWNWASDVGNSWRISGDIVDSFARYDDRCGTWDGPIQGYHCSVLNVLEKATYTLQKNAINSGWGDLDMLEVGNGGMSFIEYQTMFSMWAMLKSPLILGNDVVGMDNATQSIVSNKHIIALNQDPSGSSPARIWKKSVSTKTTNTAQPNLEDNVQLWVNSLSNSSYVIALLNASPEQQHITADWSDIFIDSPAMRDVPMTVYDLWQDAKSIGVHNGSISANVQGHGVKIYKMVPTKQVNSMKRRSRYEL